MASCTVFQIISTAQLTMLTTLSDAAFLRAKIQQLLSLFVQKNEHLFEYLANVNFFYFSKYLPLYFIIT